MKKRSVLSAVAMLLVSAIVLTSATYAWFAANSTANVDSVSASVTTTDGSLLVRAHNGTTWSTFKPVITSSDLPTFPTYFMPVSLDVDGNKSVTTYKVSYDGANFTPGAAGTPNGAGGDYIAYNLQVQYKTSSATATDVTMTPTFGRATDFTYALVKVSAQSVTTCYLFGGASNDSYTPVTAITAANTIVDDKADAAKIEGVIDATDDNYAAATLGSIITTNTTQVQTAVDQVILDDVANGTYTADISVYIWAEGQDANCVGGATAGATSISLAFAAV